LDWGTRDERFKVQLFRFVDVLPTLRTDSQFIRILKEYFEDLSILPQPLRWLLKRVSSNPLSAHASAFLLRRQFLKMAKTFMAGNSVEHALPVLRRLWDSGCAFSVDLLGEAIVSEVEADRYRDQCLHTLRVLARETQQWPVYPILEHDHLGPLPRVQLSVKFSALYSQLDPIDPEGSYENVAARLRQILDLAATLPASVIIDMEQAELKNLTVQIFTRVFSEEPYRSYPYAGIALQAYLKGASATLDHLLKWTRSRGTPIAIRLVKGAYWDSETVQYEQRGWPIPVFVNKADTDANYESLARTLLDNLDLVRPAFGSHNLRTLAHAQALAEAMKLRPEACEYQMLFGMAETLRESVVQSNLRMRVYTPIGELIPGMAYLVRRLLENTSNEGFIRRQYEAATSIDHLLAPPNSFNGQKDLHDHQGRRHPSRDRDKRLEPFRNEPHADFSQPGSLTPYVSSLSTIKQQLNSLHPYPITGGVTPSGPELISINPSAPEEVIARFHTVAPQDVDPIIQHAKHHLHSWQALSAHARAEFLFRTASLFREKRAELAAWEIVETGKPVREGDADVAEAIDFLEFYGREMVRLSQARQLGDEPGERNHAIWAPRGLAVVISPWNFSLAIPTGLVSAALVTGNVVLFKPSERSPMMGYHLNKLFEEAGLPKGVLHFLPGGPDLGQALVSHPDVQVIAFTGSKEVGLRILEEAHRVVPDQRHVKHVIAEMGGKNAIIVDETADLDEAVLGVLSSATGYQGQKCSACSRVIVLTPVFDAFLERLKQAALSIHIGPPDNPAYQMGPMIDARALERVRAYIDLGKETGQCVLDRQVGLPGYFQGPAIFTDLARDHRLVQEEIFGPVIALIRAKDFHEALHVANNTVFALTGGVYSRSPANISLACRSFDVGNVYINRSITGSLVGRQPFGGHRLSGIGKKAGGPGYLEQFMVERVISENTLRRGFAPT
jgi:RHH-type proline utilization regulon transcriptional repressor/proline dehydrogenase/delta 1-pyrroline-5-carboxylate dehydrogenase